MRPRSMPDPAPRWPAGAARGPFRRPQTSGGLVAEWRSHCLCAASENPAPGPVQNQQLVIQTMATGDVRVHQLALQNIQNAAWMPDGRALIAQGRDLDGRQGLHLVNAETGVAQR